MTTKKSKLKKVLAIALLTAAITIQGEQWANAQLQTPPTSGIAGSMFGETYLGTGPNFNNKTRSIGIGNFTGATPTDVPHAFLHINSNYSLLPANGTILNLGEVFRTTGDSSKTNAWRLFTGFGNGKEKFSLYCPAGTNNFVLQATDTTIVGGGNIRFNTGQFNTGLPKRRGQITGDTGYWGIGDYSTFTPVSILHLHDGFNTNAVRLTITGILTGATPSDGFQIGIDDTTAVFKQQERAPITFTLRNNAGFMREQLRIRNNGFTGIGDYLTIASSITTPKRRLDIFDTTSTIAQLRITQTQSGNDTLGIYTDFQTSKNGNLIIRPDSFLVHKNVGIDLNSTNQPTEKLDVNGNARFRNITTGTNSFLVTADGNGTLHKIQFPNDSTKVLRGNGTFGPGGTGGGNVTACGSAATNSIPLFTSPTTVCNSTIFQSPADSSIGIHTTTPGTLLEMKSAHPFLRFNQNTADMWDLGVEDGNVSPFVANTFSFKDNTFGGAIVFRGNYGGFGGVTNPMAPIDINTASTGDAIRINSYVASGNGPNYFRMFVNPNTISSYGSITDTNDVIYAVDSKTHRFFSGPSSGVYVMSIGGAGSGVQIGKTTNPMGKLDVTENIPNNHSISLRATIDGAVTGFSTNIAGYFSAVGGTISNEAIHVDNGDVCKFGGGMWTNCSDMKIKTDTSTFTDGLDVIKKIRPKKYKYNGLAGSPTTDTYIGVIGQEIDTVAHYTIRPYAAKLYPTDSIETPLLAVNDGALLYVSINAIKQLDSINTAKDVQIQALTTKDSILDARITQLESAVASCCSFAKTGSSNSSGDANNSTGKYSNTHVELRDAIVLNQNTPNPFSDNTIITYILPENTKGQIMFYDNNGRILKAVDVSGKGELQVFAENLSDGIYSYVLISEGKTIEKKQMLKAK